MKLIQFSLSVLFVILSFNFLFAQNEENELAHGINIYLFNGYAAGYRFNECENSFWRVNLDLYTGYTNSTINSGSISFNMSSVDTSSSENKNDNSHFNLALTPQYLYKFYQNNFVDVYTGGGLLIGYSRDQYKSTGRNNWDNSGYDYQYSVSDDYSIGLIAILGVETKLTHNFYVFVESQLSGTRGWSNTSSNGSSVSNGTEQYHSNGSAKAKGWMANFTVSRAGITIRF